MPQVTTDELLGVVGAEVTKVPFAGVDLGVQVVDEGQSRDHVPGPWLGQRESGQELAATGAKAGR